MSAMTKPCPACGGTGNIVIPIGDRLKLVRDRVGQTQEKFAKAIGISRTSLTNIEAGRQDVPLPRLVIINKLYGVSIDWLLGLVDTEPQP